MSMERPEEAALRAGIDAPVRKDGHDMPQRQPCESRLVASEQDPLALLVRETVRNKAVAAFTAVQVGPHHPQTDAASAAGWPSQRQAAQRACEPGHPPPCLHQGSPEPCSDPLVISVPRVLSPVDLVFLRRTAAQKPAATAVQPLDLFLILLVALLETLLPGHRQHRLRIGVLTCLTPAVRRLRKQAPLPAVGTEFGGIQPGSLRHHRELVGSIPALRLFLGGGHHLILQPLGLTPLVEW